MLQFNRCQIFGKAVNDSLLKKETMLGIMVNCLHGSPKFFTNMIPVAKLNTQFLFQQVNQSIESIENATGKVNAIFCDSNKLISLFSKSLKLYHEFCG